MLLRTHPLIFRHEHPHIQRYTHTHTGATLKDPGRDKKQREKRASGERERRRGSHRRAIKQSRESMVTAVRWEHGRWKSEYRCYQTCTSHTSLFFPFSHADCKPSFLQTDSHCSLVSFSVSLSWGRRMGKWKKDCRCLLRMGGGGLQWGTARVEEWIGGAFIY